MPMLPTARGPGSVLTLAGAALLAVTTCTTPLIKALPVLQLDLATAFPPPPRHAPSHELRFGCLGYCLAGPQQCTSPPRLGYRLDALSAHLVSVAAASGSFSWGAANGSAPGTGTGGRAGAAPPPLPSASLLHTLSYTFVLHPAAAGLALAACMLGQTMPRWERRRLLPRAHTLIALLAIAASVGAFALDLATFLLLRSRLRRITHIQARFGPALWLLLVAWILIFLGCCALIMAGKRYRAPPSPKPGPSFPPPAPLGPGLDDQDVWYASWKASAMALPYGQGLPFNRFSTSTKHSRKPHAGEHDEAYHDPSSAVRSEHGLLGRHPSGRARSISTRSTQHPYASTRNEESVLLHRQLSGYAPTATSDNLVSGPSSVAPLSHPQMYAYHHHHHQQQQQQQQPSVSVVSAASPPLPPPPVADTTAGGGGAHAQARFTGLVPSGTSTPHTAILTGHGGAGLHHRSLSRTVSTGSTRPGVGHSTGLHASAPQNHRAYDAFTTSEPAALTTAMTTTTGGEAAAAAAAAAGRGGGTAARGDAPSMTLTSPSVYSAPSFYGPSPRATSPAVSLAAPPLPPPPPPPPPPLAPPLPVDYAPHAPHRSRSRSTRRHTSHRGPPSASPSWAPSHSSYTHHRHHRPPSSTLPSRRASPATLYPVRSLQRRESYPSSAPPGYEMVYPNTSSLHPAPRPC